MKSLLMPIHHATNPVVLKPWYVRKLRWIKLLAVLVAVMPIAAQADHKIVPGSMCHGVTYGALEYDPLQSSVGSPDQNVSQKVICPLIRDNAGRLGPDVKVYVYNGSGRGDVTCHLRQALPQTGASADLGASPRSATRKGHDVLDFSAASGDSDNAFTTVFVECDLPPVDSNPPVDADTGLPTDGVARIRHISYEEAAENSFDDGKLFAGALCMPMTEKPGGWLRYEENPGEGPLGAVLSDASPGAFHVVCPIVRESVSVGGGLQLAAVAVSDRQVGHISDRDQDNRSLEVVCELFERDALTGAVTPLAEDGIVDEPDHQTGERSRGAQLFSMDYDLAVTGGIQKYYALHCSLAQAEIPTDCGGGSCFSKIFSYGLWEDPVEPVGGLRDWKSFTGAFCKHTPQALDPLGGGSTGYTAAGEIENPRTEAVTVTCPVLRDSTIGGSLSEAVVYVEDGHATEDVSCTFRARRGDRDDLGHSADTRTSTGTGRQALTFSVDGFGPGGTVGYYEIDCQLPAKAGGTSRVISFGIKEDLPTQ